MDQFEFGNLPNGPVRICADLLTMAEQELAAFFGAVRDLFAGRSAELG
jgi:hypothetical protein